MVRPEGRHRAPIRGQRALGIGAACLFMAVALASGLDRLSETRPALASFVPKHFRAAAYKAQARQEIAERPQQAARFARSAISADPSDIYASGLLARGLAASGDGEGAFAAYRVSAAKGWRDGGTQAFWLDQALAEGDYPQAALRLDALLRQTDAIETFQPVTDILEEAGAPREALVRRLKESPPWLGKYAAPRIKLAVPDMVRRGEVLAALGEAGSKLGCANVLKLTEALVEADALPLAARLWAFHCAPPQQNGLLNDPSFRNLGGFDGQPSPFGWRRHASGDVEMSVEPSGQHQFTLRARNFGTARRLLLDQTVSLAPGSYVVRAKVTQSGKAAAGKVDIGLSCTSVPQRPGVRQGDVAVEGQVLTVPLGCDVQRFAIWLGASGDRTEISELTLTRRN